MAGRTVALELEAREAPWEIAPGRSVRGFGFNGQVPGPTVEAEACDLLMVDFKNALHEPTTIHWHGLRVPAAMDGTESAQQPVEPGASFEYRFVLPDAGTFWYHSHVNETEQLERGLYGALFVRGPHEPLLDRERVLLLDDLKLDESCEIAAFGDPDEHHAGRRATSPPQRHARTRAHGLSRADRALADRQCSQHAVRSPLDRRAAGPVAGGHPGGPAGHRPSRRCGRRREPRREHEGALMHRGHHQRDEPVRVGDLHVWELVNETGQDHPFDLHGFFFQVLDDGDVLSWKDTVNVPRKDTVRIAWLPDDRPGEWMYHCHILEHPAMGMMAHFDVVR